MAGSQHYVSRPPAGRPVGTAAHDSHGNSIAAWTCVGTVLVATLVMALAVVFPNVAVFVVGAVLVVVGVVAGKVMSVMGFGTAGKTVH
jgi:hypothetical protein